MQEALHKEQREHELTIKSLELSRRTTQQMHALWNDVMTNPLVIPNYEHADDAEDEQLHKELRQERETQELEAPEQDPADLLETEGT